MTGKTEHTDWSRVPVPLTDAGTIAGGYAARCECDYETQIHVSLADMLADLDNHWSTTR